MPETESLTVYQLNNTGVALCAAGNYEEGIPLLRRAHELAPDDPDYCTSLGIALLENGERDDAIQFLTRATQLDPEHVAAVAILESVNPAPMPIEPEPVLLEPSTRPAAEPRVVVSKLAKSQAAASAAPVPALKGPDPLRLPAWTAWILVLFVLAGLITYYVVKTKLAVPAWPRTYTISETEQDTFANRQAAISSGWIPTLAVQYPISARQLLTYSEPSSMNVHEDTVGICTNHGALTAFEVVHSKGLTLLPPLAGDTEDGAISINDRGDIVGYSGNAIHRAVLWSHGKMEDLNVGISAKARLTLTDALNIDNTGAIVAAATDGQGGKWIVVLTQKH